MRIRIDNRGTNGFCELVGWEMNLADHFQRRDLPSLTWSVREGVPFGRSRREHRDLTMTHVGTSRSRFTSREWESHVWEDRVRSCHLQRARELVIGFTASKIANGEIPSRSVVPATLFSARKYVLRSSSSVVEPLGFSRRK